MVRRRVHGADTVETGGETSSDSSLKQTLSIAVVIDTLEKGEGLRVGSLLRCQVVAEILDSDVAVTNDLATLELLRCGVVGGQGIGEGSSNQVGELHLDVERLVGSDILSGAREEND